ncbi:hypothetical protein Gpo141_00007686 [Globisporangium polare]
MGQRLCSCLARSCCPSTPRSDALVKPALQKKDDDAPSPAKHQKQENLQQPLVVEDESWKRWSSYNLIHNQPELQRQQSAYTPPVFVSPGTGSLQQVQQQQQHHIVPAEAVWDL